MHRLTWYLFVATAAISVFAMDVQGQSERGSIRGTVTDSSGAVTAGARVTAISAATKIGTSTVTTDAGNYNIPQLPPGVYTVEIEKQGFKKVIRANVVVEVSGVTGLDLTLQIGELSESITISDAASQLKSETSEVSTSVSATAYTSLPLTTASGSSGRSLESFLFLAPGTTGDPFDAHINGSQTLSKEIQLDGLSTVIAEVQGDPRVLTLPPEAIQEMSLLTSSYSAEFGNTGGGVERFTIRSGTNEYHGNLYEYLRNDKLDARGFFNSERQINRQNEYGGSFGGPVRFPKKVFGPIGFDAANKTFFFVNFNWFKKRGGAINSLASVPPAAFRNGDLSALRNPDGSLIQIYDPATTRSNGAGGFTRDPFPGNIIPSNRISPIALNILRFVPAPTNLGLVNNFPASGNQRTDNWNYTFKIDHHFNANHHLSGSWNAGVNTDNGPFAALPHPVQSSRDGDNTQKTLRLAHDWTITPTLLNHFSAGFNRQHQLLQAPEALEDWRPRLGLTGIVRGFPVIRFDPYTNLAENQDIIEPISNTFLISDSLSWTKGRHNLKVGVDFRKLQHQGIYPSRPAQFNFSRNGTSFPTGSLKDVTGSAFASFLLGEVNDSNMYISDVVSGGRWTYLAGYVQDDFKVSPKLTLNLGLRWDLYTPLLEAHDRYSIMDPTVPNPKAGNVLGALVFAGDGPFPRTGKRRLTNGISYDNLGPRLGMAWKLTERFVVRAGYGVSYHPTGALGGGNTTGQLQGFSASVGFQTQDVGVTPAFNWRNGFPQNFDRPPLIDAGLFVGQGVSTWNDNAQEPMYRQDWNVGTQYQLAQNWLLDVAYVGAKGTRMNTGVYNLNQIDPKYLSLGSLLQQQIDDPSVVAAGFKRPYPTFTGTLAQALRPFPQYTGVGTSNSANIGNMTYHSLQAKVEKRFSQGLFLLTSYTWSKSITDSNSALGGFFSSSARDQYNRRLEKALAVYDTPHRLSTAFNYELPIGPGKAVLNKKGAVGKIIGGWQFNGILTYQSGRPITVGVTNTLPLFNGGNSPDRIQNVDPRLASRSGFDPEKDLYLNIAAFAPPGSGKFGSSATILPDVRSFPSFNEDFGLTKRAAITETVNLEFRFEMFNAFNRVIYGSPATNISDPFNYGKVSSQANAPRVGQAVLKLNF